MGLARARVGALSVPAGQIAGRQQRSRRSLPSPPTRHSSHRAYSSSRQTRPPVRLPIPAMCQTNATVALRAPRAVVPPAYGSTSDKQARGVLQILFHCYGLPPAQHLDVLDRGGGRAAVPCKQRQGKTMATHRPSWAHGGCLYGKARLHGGWVGGCALPRTHATVWRVGVIVGV